LSKYIFKQDLENKYTICDMCTDVYVTHGTMTLYNVFHSKLKAMRRRREVIRRWTQTKNGEEGACGMSGTVTWRRGVWN